MSDSSCVLSAPAQEGSPSNTQGTVIYWFRNDLRLADNRALVHACQHAENLVFVYCHSLSTLLPQRWHLPHPGLHRQRFVASALADLNDQLNAMGSQLLEVNMSAVEFLPLLASELRSKVVYCEEIAAPYEQDDILALRAAGLTVHAH